MALQTLSAASSKRQRARRLVRQPDPILRRHRWWYVFAVGVTLLGALLQQPVIAIVGLLILGVSVLPEIWYRRAQREIKLSARWGATRAFFGEAVPFEISVENEQALPLPWLEIATDLPQVIRPVTGVTRNSYRFRRYLLLDLMALWGRSSLTRTHTLRSTARGVYRIGPVRLTSSDPLGWLSRSQERATPESAETTLVVFPLIMPLNELTFPALAPFGELPTPRRLIEDPMRTAGTRDYQPGDDPRHIHWKATARLDKLRTKALEPSGQYRFVIALDVGTEQVIRYGLDPIFLELSVSAAASLAYQALEERIPTGLISNSTLIPLTPEVEPAVRSSVNDSTGVSLTYRQWVPTQPRNMMGVANVIGMGSVYPGQGVPLTPAWEREGNIAPGVVWLAPSHRKEQQERILTALAQVAPQVGPPIEALLATQRSHFGLGATVVLVSTTHALRAETVAYLMDLRRSGVGAHLALVGHREAQSGVSTYDLPVYYIGGREVWNELIKSIG